MANQEQLIREEVDNNYEAFEKKLPALIKTDQGRFALMRHGEITQIFDSAADAVIFAREKYTDGLFSVQEVTVQTVDLGYLSHAISVG